MRGMKGTPAGHPGEGGQVMNTRLDVPPPNACERGECQVMPDRTWMCAGCGGRFCAHHVCQECGAVFHE
jgi:hypothetical protein